MPWVRIDENAMDHPKFVAISANAWRLWCEGQAYCQKHLTDGVIPRQVLKGFRYYSPASMRQLTAAHVPGKGPLWHATDTGVTVHDYLEWNESAEAVHKARTEAKERRRRWRDTHVALAVGSASGDASHHSEPPGDETPNVPSGVVCIGSEALEAGESVRGGKPDTPPQRAGAFCEWYADTHERLFGVAYIGTNSDYLAALRMVEKVSNADLQDAALVWFGQDDNFATNGTRTIAKFASRATGCLQEARRVVGRSA